MSRKKRERKHQRQVARAVEKARQRAKRQAAEAANPKPAEPKPESPDIKDATIFKRHSPQLQKEIAEWDVRKERVKAARMHEEFKKTFVATGKTGKEAFDALDEFIERLKSELKDRTVREEAVATVKAMKKRLLTVLSIPKNPESAKN